VICLTECWPAMLPAGGHVAAGDADHGYPIVEGRPWVERDVSGDAAMPGGRYVEAVTEVGGEPWRVIGVCVPWRMAHVATGRRDRKAWEDHLRYLDGLGRRLARVTAGERVVVCGDFNQYVPRVGQQAALGEMRVVTEGMELIDHVAVGDGVEVRARWSWRGAGMSDHDGVGVELG
jgi:endonuclease/exonuclease/phosphatase family metal-dependent hydrolase